MKTLASFLSLLLCFALPATVLAKPRVIADLSQGALLGQVRNTPELQREFSSQRVLLADANARLGLSSSDFRAVREAIAHGRARYVEIPRHLDGMAGKYDGRAFAVHDIVIPAHVYGWEVDVNHPDALVRVFVPNQCGNLSYLRVPRRSIVAAAPVPRVIEPVMTPPPVFESAPIPQATAAPVAIAPIAPVAAPVAHHFAVLPWLALGLIGIVFLHGTPTSGTPGGPTPIPIHTICPNPAAIR